MKLVLVDGSLHLYRFYYAMNYITNSKGLSVGVFYGILSMIRKIYKKYKPDYMSFIFDSFEKNFRNSIFLEYKSHRKPMPQSLFNQIPYLYNMIKAIGIKIIIAKGVEADDVIGTLAKKAEKYGIKVLIVSNDKDVMQLVSSYIKILDIKSDTIFDSNKVIAKFGIKPQLISDYLALAGDASDNIPGIYGIGCRTAQKILNKTNGLERLFSNLNIINELNIPRSKKIIFDLIKNKNQLLNFHKLTKIKLDVEIDLLIEDLIIKKPNKKIITKILKKYEFKDYLSNIKKGSLF